MYFSFLNRWYMYEQAAEKEMKGLGNRRSRKDEFCILKSKERLWQ